MALMMFLVWILDYFIYLSVFGIKKGEDSQELWE